MLFQVMFNNNDKFMFSIFNLMLGFLFQHIIIIQFIHLLLLMQLECESKEYQLNVMETKIDLYLLLLSHDLLNIKYLLHMKLILFDLIIKLIMMVVM